ncbi:MAG: hypothetical protein NVSMB2_25730 [Chloroflexota bacterium]
MIFVDYLGPGHQLGEVAEVVTREVSAAMRVRAEQIAVRRIVTEGPDDDIELWIELSTDEQLYRLGQTIARRVSTALRPNGDERRVWVMFRVVPLSHAFVNGEPRARGTGNFD